MATYTHAEVAALFHKTPGGFGEVRRRLEGAGFPPRLPGCILWSKPAVDLWLLNWGQPEAICEATAQAAITEQTRHLEDKYAGGIR